MRLLPAKYSDIEKSLPLLVSTKDEMVAYYTSPVSKDRKTVKVPKGSTFSISPIIDKKFTDGEEVFVNSDLIVIRGITAGKAGRVYGQFKYSDLSKNATILDPRDKRIKPITKSLLIFGLPRKTFFVGLGAIMVLAGIYLRNRKK